VSILARLKRVNARQPPEEDVRVRLAVLAAVMTATVAVITQQVGGLPFRLLVLAGIPLAYAYSWRTRYAEGFWLKLVVAVGAVGSLAWFLATVAHITGGSFADVQVPLAELFLLVQALHGLDVPARRDLLFSLLSSAVLMAVAGVLSISMSFLPFLAVWATAAVAALVLSHASELRAHGLLAPRSGARSGAGHLRRTAGVLALALGAGLAVFSLVPAAGTARSLAFPSVLRRVLALPTGGALSNPTLGSADPAGGAAGTSSSGAFPGERKQGSTRSRSSFGYFGFSNDLDLAARGRPDNTLVMRVRADRPALWRGQTFDRWDGQRWTSSAPGSRLLPASVPTEIEPGNGQQLVEPGRDFVQTYYLAQTGPNLIFGAAPISRLYFPDPRVYELADGTLRSGVLLGKGTIYTVVSRPPPVTAGDLRRGDPLEYGVPTSIARLDAAPPITTERVRALARQVTAAAPTTYDKVLALEAWMGANTRYTLNVPDLPGRADAVDQYLFVDRRGFCEQIASSLVVMLRSLGVPARVVAGYAPGQRNPLTGLYEVRASDAHAWAEVWFPGAGWQSFDPTAEVPLAGDAQAGRAAQGLGTYLAARFPHVPKSVGFPVGAAAGLVALLWVGRRPLAAFRSRRRPVSWEERCQRRVEQWGAAQGRPRQPAETLPEYVGVLGAGPPLARAAAIVSRAAFGPVLPSEAEREEVEAALATGPLAEVYAGGGYRG